MEKRKNSKVTLKDIAEDTGFSISTVSRAISGNSKISTETEHIIYESAQRLNYPIKSTTPPVALRKNIFIALVTKFHTGEFYSSFYNGFDNATNGTNTNIALLSISNIDTDKFTLVNELQKTNFDGAILFLPDFKQDDYKKLITHTDPNFPIVSVANITNPVMDTITFDAYRGGYLVAEHFYKLGYKNVGIIHGPLDKPEAMLRKNGFSDFISLNDGIELMWNYDGNFENSSGIEGYNSYKQAYHKPDAIFCTNDSMTVGFIQNAQNDGVRIPEDIAIASYDDLPICEYHNPSITSVHTPFKMLGKKAIQYIMDRLKNGNDSAQHTGSISLVPVYLNVRESTTRR